MNYILNFSYLGFYFIWYFILVIVYNSLISFSLVIVQAGNFFYSLVSFRVLFLAEVQVWNF